MDAVVIDPDPETIAERRRLGLDRFDEVWDGEYHMVPPPNGEHQGVGAELFLLLAMEAKAVGLLVRYEIGLLHEGADDWQDFRVPDLAVFDEAVGTTRGVQGGPHLAVEIRSPGDESFKKIPFYEAVGTRELLIIDRGARWVRRWARVEGRLVETTPEAGDAPVRLECLPIELVPDGAGIACRADGGREALLR